MGKTRRHGVGGVIRAGVSQKRQNASSDHRIDQRALAGDAHHGLRFRLPRRLSHQSQRVSRRAAHDHDGAICGLFSDKIMVPIIRRRTDDKVYAGNAASALQRAGQCRAVAQEDKLAVGQCVKAAPRLYDHCRAHHVPRGWKAVASFESQYQFYPPNGPLTDTTDRGLNT